MLPLVPESFVAEPFVADPSERWAPATLHEQAQSARHVVQLALQSMLQPQVQLWLRGLLTSLSASSTLLKNEPKAQVKPMKTRTPTPRMPRPESGLLLTTASSALNATKKQVTIKEKMAP
jgi:hypothetical protein